MSVELMPDERLARYYENIRQQVEAERACKYKFMTNPTVHQYAGHLRSEMIKRRLKHSPIEWPNEMARKYREVVDEERQQESNPVATGKSPMIGVRMHEEMQDLIKNPAAEQNDHPSLSGAIRSLVERGKRQASRACAYCGVIVPSGHSPSPTMLRSRGPAPRTAF